MEVPAMKTELFITRGVAASSSGELARQKNLNFFKHYCVKKNEDRYFYDKYFSPNNEECDIYTIVPDCLERDSE